MATRKAILLTGLLVAVTALNPTATLANAGGTDRPLRGGVSGTATGTVGGGFVGEGAGTLTHVGHVTATIEGTADNTTQIGQAALNGTITFVAANGAQLTGTISGTAVLNGEVTLVGTITGGTGRFEGARGTFTVAGSDTGVFDNPNFTVSFQFPFTGEISYQLKRTIKALEAARLSEQAMAQENVEVVKAAFEAFGRDDWSTLIGCLDPEIEWVTKLAR